jgi:Tol biopolymer transport system component
MRAVISFLFVLLLFGACSIDTSCSGPGRDIIPSDPGSANAKAAWSPDAQTIAVAWAGNPTFRRQGIFLIDTSDWTVDTLLIAADELSTPFFSSPSWSPSGEWLIFAASAQIYKIKANGDSLMQLTYTSRQWECDWSDSDTLIAYGITLGDSAGTWLMRPDGSNKRQIIPHGFAPCFTRGDSILFLANSATAPEDSAHFSLFNPFNSTVRLVYAWEKGKPYSTYYYPKVSPDGQKIALSIDVNIWTLSIDGQKLRQLTADGGSHPNWSPDRSKVIYCKPDTNGGTLWIMNADGTGKTQIEGW